MSAPTRQPAQAPPHGGPVALVTYAALPQLARDDQLAIPHLAARGLHAEPVAWDAPADWRRYRAVVLRSCWDYHLRPAEFAAWVDRLAQLGVPLWNPPAIVRWNIEKGYLRDLAARGVAVPPTAWLDRGATPDLAALLRERGWSRAVVKPTISATAHNTWLTSPATAGADQPRLAAQLAGSAAMVQEFVAEVVEQGEWSLMFFGGRFSHAVLKQARPGDFRVQDDFGGTAVLAQPSPALIAQAQQLLGCVEAPLLYARVDAVERGGRLLLIELELIEPSLFLAEAPEAPARLAQAIAEYLS